MKKEIIEKVKKRFKVEDNNIEIKDLNEKILQRVGKYDVFIGYGYEYEHYKHDYFYVYDIQKDVFLEVPHDRYFEHLSSFWGESKFTEKKGMTIEDFIRTNNIKEYCVVEYILIDKEYNTKVIDKVIHEKRVEIWDKKIKIYF